MIEALIISAIVVALSVAGGFLVARFVPDDKPVTHKVCPFAECICDCETCAEARAMRLFRSDEPYR